MHLQRYACAGHPRRSVRTQGHPAPSPVASLHELTWGLLGPHTPTGGNPETGSILGLPKAQVSGSLGPHLKKVTRMYKSITSRPLLGAQSSFPSCKVDRKAQGGRAPRPDLGPEPSPPLTSCVTLDESAHFRHQFAEQGWLPHRLNAADQRESVAIFQLRSFT